MTFCIKVNRILIMSFMCLIVYQSCSYTYWIQKERTKNLSSVRSTIIGVKRSNLNLLLSPHRVLQSSRLVLLVNPYLAELIYPSLTLSFHYFVHLQSANWLPIWKLVAIRRDFSTHNNHGRNKKKKWDNLSRRKMIMLTDA